MTRNKRPLHPAPKNLASLLRGLYARVARKLNLDPSYVSRVARDERKSQRVELAIRTDLEKIMSYINKKQRRKGKKTAGKKPIKKK